MNTKFLNLIKTIITVGVLTIGATYIYADWSGPPGAPTACPESTPGCNVPINESVTAQVKRAGLGLWGRFYTKDKASIGLADPTTMTTSLTTQINGKVGADAYCDQAGNNCIIPPGGAGGGFWAQVNNSDRIQNTNPGRVDIQGKVKIAGGDPSRNKVLAANNEGVGSWKSLAELGVGGDFKVSCPTGQVIQSIDTSKTPPVTCVKLSNGSTGGGLFNWNFTLPGGGGGGSSYSTTCSTDNRDATCRVGYTRVQLVNCGTEMINNVPWPKTYAVCEPNNQ
jgi:hypothetical protein